MARNEHRDSAGRTLMGFAVVVLLVTVATGQDWWDKEKTLEWIALPTAVEDQDLYAGIGDSDFEQPNLVYWGAPEGVVRLSPTPLMLRDFRMRKLVDPRASSFRFTRDASDSVFIYRYDKDPFDPEVGIPSRIFVKVSDNHYVEFGQPPAGAAAAAP